MYGTTTYTAAIGAIPAAFGVSQRVAVLGYTLPFFGVFFAPIYTPHLSERYGRRPIYFTSFPLFCLCVVVIGLATNISTLLAFRFLAGLFGGPCVVLIEGTFADVWPAHKTVTYYSFLTLASYLGAASGMCDPHLFRTVLIYYHRPYHWRLRLCGQRARLAVMGDSDVCHRSSCIWVFHA